MSNFYVYGHFRGETPFYIGKGSRRRAWVTQGRSAAWDEEAARGEYEVRIIDRFAAEGDACGLEASLISKYGLRAEGGDLVNVRTSDIGRTKDGVPRVPIQFTLDAGLWDRLDRWISQRDFPVPRGAVVEKAVTRFLDEEERGQRPDPSKDGGE